MAAIATQSGDVKGKVNLEVLISDIGKTLTNPKLVLRDDSEKTFSIDAQNRYQVSMDLEYKPYVFFSVLLLLSENIFKTFN